MKVKLLRKIRKRFEINYYPNGYEFAIISTTAPCVVLIEKSFFYNNGSKIREIGYVNDMNSKEHMFKNCLITLMWLIPLKYAGYGIRRNKKLKKTEEKLWYNIK